jgi:hypothetical protein
MHGKRHTDAMFRGSVERSATIVEECEKRRKPCTCSIREIVGPQTRGTRVAVEWGYIDIVLPPG